MTLLQAKLLAFLILAATEGGWMSRGPRLLQALWAEVKRQTSLQSVWRLIPDDEQWQVENYLKVWGPKPVDTPQGGATEAATATSEHVDESGEIPPASEGEGGGNGLPVEEAPEGEGEAQGEEE